tara:strand:+ start:202 stop:600 length:399 start_codon:yes stop_codon:yes gene_type:complete
MNKFKSIIKEISNNKNVKLFIESSKRFWAKCMKSFTALNLRNQAFTVFILLIISFYSGFLFGNINTSSKGAGGTQKVQKGKCDKALWRQVNIQCRGDASCAGRVYREASGGDISGGLDCANSAFKKKMEFIK